MKRIIYHWTAGTYKPNTTDLLHYHYVIDDNGNIFDGVYSIEDNENCLDGVYAAHTGGGNTGSIGIAFAGMFGFQSKEKPGRYPLTAKQLEAGWELGAKLIKKYKLNISDPMCIQTHYGFGVRNPRSSSAGKVDIIFMPPFPMIGKNDIEKHFRQKIAWYYTKLK